MCGCLQLREVRRDFAIFEEGREGTGWSGGGVRETGEGEPHSWLAVLSHWLSPSAAIQKKKKIGSKSSLQRFWFAARLCPPQANSRLVGTAVTVRLSDATLRRGGVRRSSFPGLNTISSAEKKIFLTFFVSGGRSGWVEKSTLRSKICTG